jgi:hypothetical protein
MDVLVAAAMVWWLDVYVEERQLTPEWEVRVAELLREASDLYRIKHHPLDVACDVELRAHSISVYRPGFNGWLEGAAPHRGINPPMPFTRTRLYIVPGPGWAVGSAAENWAYAWVGLWTGYPGASGTLLDPWGRPSDAWAVAHELGHPARLEHRDVLQAQDCSLMAYDAMLQVDCPENGARLTQMDCDAIRRRAAEQPGTGTGSIQFLMPPRPPIVLP